MLPQAFDESGQTATSRANPEQGTAGQLGTIAAS
jgi:hypothetical protein